MAVVSSEVKTLLLFVLFIRFIAVSPYVHKGLPCARRYYGPNKFVCVCNVTYCDTLEVPSESPAAGTAYVVRSSQAEGFFASETATFTQNEESNKDNSISTEETVKVTVDFSQEFQEIFGFGGSFTDAAGINFVSLPPSMKMAIVHSYYSAVGSEYNIGRVPMGSTDFSTHPYSYDDTSGDFQLEKFQLAEEDLNYKIPFVQEALKVSTQPLLLFGSPWAPPSWMKTNNRAEGDGQLRGDVGGQYYQTWANYFVKFLQAYEAHNITFWGLTAQNEPTDGFLADFKFQCLAFSPETQAAFIAQNLGPALKKAGYGTDKVKLMIMDDQRFLLPSWATKVFSNATASDYVSGIAYHWYLNWMAPARLLDLTHDLYPDKFLFASEACNGANPWDLHKVDLGDWGRAESYAHDIITDLQHWTTGWTDWNLALDLQGGPNWVQNFVDSPIIVNATGAEFYKQPMYYFLAQFSKFIKYGSRRVLTEVEGANSKLEMVAFKTPNSHAVLIVLNRSGETFDMEVKEKGSNSSMHLVMRGHGIMTTVWGPLGGNNN